MITENEPLSKHTYYRIGGPARWFVTPTSREELSEVAKFIGEKNLRYVVIGSGSNLLVTDEGFDGLVIKATKIDSTIEVQGERLRLGASVAVSSLLRRCSEEGWGGLELLTGIPGSIGGVVAMNAGTHLGEAKDRLLAVESFDLANDQTIRREGSALKYSYRTNHFLKPSEVVLSSDWRVDHRDPTQVKSLIEETLARRKASQPLDRPSCGSVFKNPPGMRAWEVIDKLGLRGHRIGNAQFSDKHPNFILNLGGAKAMDVRALIDLARERARLDLQIELEPEVKVLGP